MTHEQNWVFNLMTHEQDWAFYKLVPKLIARGLITPAVFEVGGVEMVTREEDIGQEILEIAREDGVLIDADAACDSCREEEGREPSTDDRSGRQASVISGALAPA